MSDGLRRLRTVLPQVVWPQLDARLTALQHDLTFSRQVEAIKRGRFDALVRALCTTETRRRLFKAAGEGARRRLASRFS